MQWINETDAAITAEDVEAHTVFRKVGWLGQTGRFYADNEDPSKTERGGFSPVYVQIMPE